MSVPELFIRRPVMTTLVMAGILLFGLIGFRQLPVSDLPNVDYPTIQISASLPGASPQTMASAVATPLEKQLSTIAGVDSMSSVSSLGSVSITIQFSLDRSIDAAAQDVQAAIAQAARQLPPNMPSPPTYQQSQPGGLPDRLSGDVFATRCRFRLWTITRKTSWRRKFRWSTASRRSMSSARSPTPCASRWTRTNWRPTDWELIRSSRPLKQGNVDQPLGILYGKHQAFTVQANGQLNDAAEFRPLIVAYRNGNPVRLEQLGNVLDSVQNDKMAAWFNGTRAPSCWRFSASPARTRWRWWTTSRNCCRSSAKKFPRRCIWTWLIDRSSIHPPIRARMWRTRCSGRLPRRAGDFLFPAKSIGDAHSQPRAADVAHRHFRRDGAARLQPRQSFAHGADVVRRLRRGRRHCHARKHRASHGKRRAADGSRVAEARGKSASPSFP